MDNDRRRFLATTAALGMGTVVLCPNRLRSEEKEMDKKNHPVEEVSAPEDLMREHGILNRILLVYDEGLRRLHDKQEVPPDVFHKTAALVRKFVEDYHEKLEEEFIFPEFEKQKKLTDLVEVLRAQHQAGRKLTEKILRASGPDEFRREDARQGLVTACQAFIRMYRPHEAREDTVLFPALRKIVAAKRIDELGEQFEEREHKLFGEEGFEKTVDEVATIEKQLSIYELSQFTPK